MLTTPDCPSPLANAPLFGSVSEQSRSVLMQSVQIVALRKDQDLFQQGDPALAFFVVVSGWVSLYRVNAVGRRVDLGMFGPGDSFAEAAHAMAAYPASAQAASAACVARIEWRLIEPALRDDPDFSRALSQSITVHLRAMADKVADRSLLSAHQQLARYLLRHAVPDGRQGHMRLPYAKTVLARDLGLSPETLSRAFQRLVPCGVHLTKRDVRIDDMRALRDCMVAN